MEYVKNGVAAEINIPDNIQSKWQNIIDMMAKILNVLAGLIMRIVDTDIKVFLSSKTENNPYIPGAKEHLKDSGLYCETVLNTNKMLIVHNALIDEYWKNNPDININMISYLGFPINLPDKTPFGTICILDNKENEYSGVYIDLMKNMQNIIEMDLELLYMNHSLGETNKQFSDYISEIYTLRTILPICANCKKIRDDKGYWNQIEEYFLNHSDIRFSHGLCEKCEKEMYGNENWYNRIKQKS